MRQGVSATNRFKSPRRQRKTPRGRFPRGVLSQSCLVSSSSRSARGAKIDLALRQRGQLLVGCLFLIEGLVQNTGAIVAAKLLRPSDQASVARGLIVLGGLGGGDPCRIHHRFIRDFAGDFVRLPVDVLDLT